MSDKQRAANALSAMTAETCDNCGKAIGRLETPHIHGDHVVCLVCADTLRSPVVHYATPQSTAMHRPVQTIQATGKKWKLLRVAGVLGIIAGAVILFIGVGMKEAYSSTIGGTLFVLSLAAYIFSRVGAWWSHG